jgi:threonine/homoserine/homoserine lactone efflux protein
MEAVLCLTPGPAVLFVLSSAIKAGAKKSIASNAGILAANLVYFALSATGIGAILLSSKLFFAVKWLGAGYLIIVGLRALFGRSEIIPAEIGAVADHQARRLFSDAFIVQMSNPKAVLFFTALLPQFIHPNSPVVPQIVILGLTSTLIEFAILLGYGVAAGRASELARQPRYARWTNRVAGGLLIGAGAGLATR